MDDRELLASLIESGSREALGRIVERYVDLVYSAALRQLGDRHLAEDVTQGVFIVLAKKAKSLRGDVLLGPWLLKVTRYAALNALKAKNRRKQHEERAAAMRTEIDQLEEAHWDEIREVLDEALITLSEKDRRAVVLRYFEQRSVDEVANLMGVTPEAAKQRIFRAIEKLRGRLGGKGVVVTAAALALVIGARAVEAAPLGLAGSVTAATGGGLAAGSAACWVAKGTVKFMAWTKLKAAAIVTATALLTGGSALVIKRGMSNGDGGVAPRLPATPVADVTAAKNPQAGATAEKPVAKNWFEKFDAVYRPAQGEAVKRIAPRFIDERWNWWKSQQPRIPALKPGEKMFEKQFLMEWDGAAYRWKMASVVDGNLAGVMMSILGVKGWEVDGPAELKGFSLPGDWVVVRGAKFEDKVAALEKIVREAGKKVQIKQVGKTMDVFVARGTVNLKGPVDDRGRHILEMGLGDKPPRDGRSQAYPDEPSSATVREVFNEAEELFGKPFIDESGSELSRVMFRQYLGTSKLSHEQQLANVLTSLMRQTGLELEPEKREIKVWRISEEK